MLHTKTLWLSRADLLGDPHEGAYGGLNLQLRSSIYTAERGYPEDIAAQLELVHRRAPGHYFVNCWNQSDVESAAMWTTYGRQGQAIAVRSNFQRLTQSILGDLDVYVGTVEYTDYTSAFIDESQGFAPFLHKRRSFESEQELRLIAAPNFGDWSDEPAPVPGVPVPVALENLIELIYVGPDEPHWFLDAVTAAVTRFGLQTAVQQSDLDHDPLY